MFKRKLTIIPLILSITASGLTGCGSVSTVPNAAASPTDATVSDDIESSVNENGTAVSETNLPDTIDTDKMSIVCTIYPEYDWVIQILGDHAANAEVSYLLDNGVDLHSYQPTADDIIKVSTCDLFVYVGGGSDGWAEEALISAVNKDMKVINMMDVLGDSAKVEELKEGMQGHDHEHEHEHAEIKEEDIKDREITDFAGNRQSLYPLLESGELEEYVEHHAKEHDGPIEEVRDELAQKWGRDATEIGIDGNMIGFTYSDGTQKSGEYEYAGYSPVLAEDGGIHAVLYKYEVVSGDSPKYVMFNDHGYEPAKAEHFHICYGDDTDFDTTLENFVYNPFFISSGLNGEEAVEMLEGHSHSNSADHDHEHDHEDGEHDDHDHEHHHEDGEVEYDEHVWLSLSNAKVLCAEIESNISAIDPANAADYKADLDAYTTKLDELDGRSRSLVDPSSVKTLVFGDRFPFRYFVDDHGLDYFAAFIGCSAETEASFETIVFLSDKANELDSKTIFTIEGSDKSIAQTVINTSGRDMKIAELNSLQSVSADDINSGVTYLSLMEDNYNVLCEALK